MKTNVLKFSRFWMDSFATHYRTEI